MPAFVSVVTVRVTARRFFLLLSVLLSQTKMFGSSALQTMQSVLFPSRAMQSHVRAARRPSSPCLTWLWCCCARGWLRRSPSCTPVRCVRLQNMRSWQGIWPRQIPCSWQGILSLGDELVRVLRAWDGQSRAQNSLLQRLVFEVFAGSFYVEFCCPQLLLVSGYVPSTLGETATGMGMFSPPCHCQLYLPP